MTEGKASMKPRKAEVGLAYIDGCFSRLHVLGTSLVLLGSSLHCVSLLILNLNDNLTR